MKSGRHLILQEHMLPPSVEWPVHCQDWLMVRLSEGTGYWLQPNGPTRQLSTGDGLITAHNLNGIIRSSQLGESRLQFFTIAPEYLNGLLTINEWHRLRATAQSVSPYVSFFDADSLTGGKFAQMAQTQADLLSARCDLLQLWFDAVADSLAASTSTVPQDTEFRDRFRLVVGQLTEVELSRYSAADLAQLLHCSERHITRMFRREFGVPLRAMQIRLRLKRAQQLLQDSNSKIIDIAYESGHRNLGLFNISFKKHFGVTPSKWRQQHAHKKLPVQIRGSLRKLAMQVGVATATLSGP